MYSMCLHTAGKILKYENHLSNWNISLATNMAHKGLYHVNSANLTCHIWCYLLPSFFFFWTIFTLHFFVSNADYVSAHFHTSFLTPGIPSLPPATHTTSKCLFQLNVSFPWNLSWPSSNWCYNITCIFFSLNLTQLRGRSNIRFGSDCNLRDKPAGSTHMQH